MRLRYPAYFENFRCTASACQDSCCKEWEVQVDDTAAASYLALSGPLGDALRRHLYRDEAGEWYLRIADGRCPMWRSDGLCRIQAEQGHDALCQTCRDFPRLTHDYGDFVERGLEMSCPEAARMIFENPNAPWLEQECDGGEEPDYDPMDMEILLETRKVMLTILADETRDLPESLALALLYGYQAQSRLDGDEAHWSPAEALAFARQIAEPADIAMLPDFYERLEILTDAWRNRLQSPSGAGQWDARLRTLARYGVERYWLQAISDFDVVGRVKMVIAACLLVRHLGGDLVETAQLYAKEIENNDENVEAILEAAYAHPALTDDKLLYWLLLEEV